MVKKKLKEIETKINKIEKRLKKKKTIPEKFDQTLKQGTGEIVRILDQTLKEIVPDHLRKKKRSSSTLKTRKGLKLALFGKKKK